VVHLLQVGVVCLDGDQPSLVDVLRVGLNYNAVVVGLQAIDETPLGVLVSSVRNLVQQVEVLSGVLVYTTGLLELGDGAHSGLGLVGIFNVGRQGP
jgi:hypothetical protein